MSTCSFLITQIDTEFVNDGSQGSPLVYAYNTANIEWGAICNKPSIPVNNFPILYTDSPIPTISFLQVATLRGQYQLYWNDGVDDQAIILLQDLTSTKPYPNNQTALWTGPKTNQNFKLVIDQTAPENESGIKLVAL
ncbi:hypothetical protein C2869_01790 [Saccharobesus litoralis]|uniref:Uncharacterized protein n=1 Tax=Saccharobesus litoralis TaxID=2172099 RepID=A0A2S0VM22_9ALTE|nr:hypothetical protein [Saccharobesus litoralis]AWB65253.1 hypothetical protein C2869_01790 [Saccharobesus litoralis]